MSAALLSVNINKYALLRNSRGRDVPNLLAVADMVLAAGAHGITVHPRRDERHIRMDDLQPLSDHLATHHPGVELNVECENHPELIARVLQLKPAQCTLVPVRPGEVTSDHGYRFPDDHKALAGTLAALRAAGVRSSLFVESRPEEMQGAAAAGADRVELYTGPYAWTFGTPDHPTSLNALRATAQAAVDAGLEVNAGHDLDRHNLPAMAGLPGLKEVSIGHAQICRALYVGTTAAVQELLVALGHHP